MSIYAIGDLHLSFNNPKPMNIFGENWNNYEQKIKIDWENKVKAGDTVILPGDFSWEMYLKDMFKDFEFLNSLPGKKIMLRGNHDYWWTTVKSMKKFLNEKNIENIEFLQNNSFEIEDKIICGTRGWSVNLTTENIEEHDKMINRESIRLELSIKSALNKRKESQKEIIVFMHYPPILKQNIKTEFMEILKKYDIKKCYYAHLHGDAIKDAVEGEFEGIEFKLVSSDGLKFELLKI